MKGGRSISSVCLMFQLYQSNTRAYRDASFRVPPPPPPPTNDIQRESGVDPGARFQRDAQSTMKRSRCCKRSAGVGMRVKSQPAAMKRRRSVLIQFPSKTVPPKYFTMRGKRFTCMTRRNTRSREPAPACADRIIPDAASEMQFVRYRTIGANVTNIHTYRGSLRAAKFRNLGLFSATAKDERHGQPRTS